MNFLNQSSLRLFADKLAARSTLTDGEQQALANLPAQAAQIDAYVDDVRRGERVEHACLIVDGIIGRFGQNRDVSR